MGAYHAALTQLYPDRKVTCAILWTRTAELMPLDDAQIRAALVRTPTS
jgi:ATP-dependent helicase/nuclease subunit A